MAVQEPSITVEEFDTWALDQDSLTSNRLPGFALDLTNCSVEP